MTVKAFGELVGVKTSGMLTISQVAKRLGLRRQTIYYHIKAGHFQVHTLGGWLFIYEHEFDHIRELLQTPPGISVVQAAELLGLATPTIYSLLRTGSLKAEKIKGVWRFDKSSIEAYNDRREAIAARRSRKGTDFA